MPAIGLTEHCPFGFWANTFVTQQTIAETSKLRFVVILILSLLFIPKPYD